MRLRAPSSSALSRARAPARLAAAPPLPRAVHRHHRHRRAAAAADDAVLARLEAATDARSLAALLDSDDGAAYLSTPLATVALMHACVLPPTASPAAEEQGGEQEEGDALKPLLLRLAAASRPHAAALPLSSRAQLALALARHRRGPIYDAELFSAIATACAADLEEEAEKRLAGPSPPPPAPQRSSADEDDDDDLELASTVVSLLAVYAIAGHYDERLFTSLCAAARPLLRPGSQGGGGGGVLRAEPRALCAVARALADAQHYDAALLREVARAAGEHGPEAFAALGGAEGGTVSSSSSSSEDDDDDEEEGEQKEGAASRRAKSKGRGSPSWRLDELGGLLQSLAFLRAPGRAPFVAASLSFCATAGASAWRKDGGGQRGQSAEAVARLWRASALLGPQLPALARRLAAADAPAEETEGDEGGERRRAAEAARLARLRADLDELLARLADEAAATAADEEAAGGKGEGAVPLACAPAPSALALLRAAVELRGQQQQQQEEEGPQPVLLSRALYSLLEGAGAEREASWRRAGLLAPAEVAARLEEVLAALSAAAASLPPGGGASSAAPRLLLPKGEDAPAAAVAGPGGLLRLDLAVDAPPAARAAAAAASPPAAGGRRRKVAVLVLPPSAYCAAVVPAAVGGGNGGAGAPQSQPAERLRGAAAADVLILRGEGWGVVAVPAAEWARLSLAAAAGAGGASGERQKGGGRRGSGASDAVAALQAEYLSSRLAAGLAEAAAAAQQQQQQQQPPGVGG